MSLPFVAVLESDVLWAASLYSKICCLQSQFQTGMLNRITASEEGHDRPAHVVDTIRVWSDQAYQGARFPVELFQYTRTNCTTHPFKLHTCAVWTDVLKKLHQGTRQSGPSTRPRCTYRKSRVRTAVGKFRLLLATSISQYNVARHLQQ